MTIKKRHLNSLITICNLFFKSLFTSKLMTDLVAIFYNRKKCTLELAYPDWRHTIHKKITYFITKKLGEWKPIYVNDHTLDTYKLFHQKEFSYNEDKLGEVDIYSYLNTLFEYHQLKVLAINANGDNIIFLSVTFSYLKTLLHFFLKNTYFKVSDVTDDTIIPVKNAFGLLPPTYQTKQHETPTITFIFFNKLYKGLYASNISLVN